MSNNNSINKVRSVIARLDRDGDRKVFPDNPNIPPFRTASIRTAEGESLKQWVVKEKAINSIEIGLAYGFSTLYICEGLLHNEQNPKHTIIDAWQTKPDKYANIGLDLLAKAGVEDIIEFHGEKSQIVLPRFLAENRKFDFAFVDGNHRFDYVFSDLFYLGQLVRLGGVIFMDDYNAPGIKKAAKFFVKNLGWRIEDDGSDKEREWAILRISEKEDSRQYDYFVDF